MKSDYGLDAEVSGDTVTIPGEQKDINKFLDIFEEGQRNALGHYQNQTINNAVDGVKNILEIQAQLREPDQKIQEKIATKLRSLADQLAPEKPTVGQFTSKVNNEEKPTIKKS